MAAEDGFQLGSSFRSSSPRASREETRAVGMSGRAGTWRRSRREILKDGVFWPSAVTAIGIAILSIGNPVALVANVTDWWVDKPALQPEADPATSTIQTIAGTQIRRRQRRTRRRARKLLRLWNLSSQARPRPPGKGRPRPPVSARPRTASQSLPTTSRSLKNCSSNSRPGQPKKRRGNRPGPRWRRRYGWRKMARRRRGPRRDTDWFTPRELLRGDPSAATSSRKGPGATTKTYLNRSRP